MKKIASGTVDRFRSGFQLTNVIIHFFLCKGNERDVYGLSRKGNALQLWWNYKECHWLGWEGKAKEREGGPDLSASTRAHRRPKLVAGSNKRLMIPHGPCWLPRVYCYSLLFSLFLTLKKNKKISLFLIHSASIHLIGRPLLWTTFCIHWSINTQLWRLNYYLFFLRNELPPFRHYWLAHQLPLLANACLISLPPSKYG